MLLLYIHYIYVVFVFYLRFYLRGTTMAWLEITLTTTHEASELITDTLLALGAEGSIRKIPMNLINSQMMDLVLSNQTVRSCMIPLM